MRPIDRLCYIVLLSTASVAAVAQPAADVARGGRVFLQCSACHAQQPGGPTLVGPALGGPPSGSVVGRPAASRPDYAYSEALKSAGLVWNEATLDAWLTKPSAVVPGTRMSFIGLSNPDLRRDVIAYLATFR